METAITLETMETQDTKPKKPEKLQMRSYERILESVHEKFGEDAERKLVETARKNYAGFAETIAAQPNQTMRFHVDIIAQQCAMYLALRKHLPKSAYKLMDSAMHQKCRMVNLALGKLTRIPGSGELFIKLCHELVVKLFGEDAGFETDIEEYNKDHIIYRVTKCVYCEYCAKFGCPELTRLFCDSDEYNFGGLAGVDFTRTQTLAKGGECCDFCFTALN